MLHNDFGFTDTARLTMDIVGPRFSLFGGGIKIGDALTAVNHLGGIDGGLRDMSFPFRDNLPEIIKGAIVGSYS